MKKIILVFLVIGAAFLLVRSPSSKIDSREEGKIMVLSTTAMIGSVVSEIGGEQIVSDCLILGEIDPHSYELVKGDDEKIDRADIVFYNGLRLEHGASLRYKLVSDPKAIALGDEVLRVRKEKILFQNEIPDPHIWMDISLWTEIIDPIVRALSERDPEHRMLYQSRGERLREKMLQLHEEAREHLAKIPSERRYLVTSHDAFGYFTRAYLAEEGELDSGDWKRRFAAPEGLAPDGQLGISDLREIIEYLEEYRVFVVFPESNVSRDSLKKILFACKEKNLPVRFSGKSLYGDCMGDAPSYFAMLEHDVSVLISEWDPGR